MEVLVLDNSGRSDDKQAWYDRALQDLDARVIWWDATPFNYSAVNNRGASEATGEVLAFMNDDTQARSPGWLKAMVGWAACDEVGTVGAQLIDPDGLIQHGGVVLGMDGSAGHLFAGVAPGGDTLIGHTDWVRNVLASTAACVVLRREVFEACGGFDERFELCGSDVVLGLDAHLGGWRNVVVPGTGVAHEESATLGPSGGVEADLYASWWRYQRWLSGGDPFYSPSLSLTSTVPTLRPPGELPAREAILSAMHRPTGVFRQQVLEETASAMAAAYPVGRAVVEEVDRGHRAVSGSHEVRTLNWVLPRFDNPHYGGLATVFRIARLLWRDHAVQQRFVICDRNQELFYRSAVAAAAPELARSSIVFTGGDGLGSLELIPPADAVVATMWTTAYVAAAAADQRRRFYLVQDHEPTFYPAGSLCALAEETYRLGLYGICNTEPIPRCTRGATGVGAPGSFRRWTGPCSTHRRSACPFGRRPGTPAGVRLRPSGPLAQLLGDRGAGAAGPQAHPRRPPPRGGCGLLGHTRGPRRRHRAPRDAGCALHWRPVPEL
ncbi:MAG: glycosyltransferase [Microthrixaceae bacterium]